LISLFGQTDRLIRKIQVKIKIAFFQIRLSNTRLIRQAGKYIASAFEAPKCLRIITARILENRQIMLDRSDRIAQTSGFQNRSGLLMS
jgi:hypothetical protein